jgi:uncharacterized ion transporter superfamily protein YfcC
MKVYLRVTLSVITITGSIAIANYFFEEGFLKYLFIGIIIGPIYVYNDKKNKELESKNKSIR